MGTEIFPLILTFMKFVVGTVVVFAVLVIAFATFEYRYVHVRNAAKRAEMKQHIVVSLVAIVIILIVYLLLSAVGPVFRLLFLG